jgi:hypothetical protein
MHVARRLAIFTLSAAAVAAAGCASTPTAVPSNASVGAGPAARSTPKIEPNDAPPAILRMHFSSLDVRRGQRWSGQFVTGTNVASVEVRTSLFSIDVPRTAFGRFAFDLDVLDVPPIFVRPYRLRVIARNSAGRPVEQNLPFEIR